MTKRVVGAFTIAGLLVSTGACSVGMAARTGGVKPEQVMKCQTRQCFLALDTAEVVDKQRQQDGSLTEVYRFQLKRGSAGRAAMHGLLDVATVGLWEVVGTPLEATKKRKFMVIKANYAPDGRLKSAAFTGEPTEPEMVEDAPAEDPAADG